MLRRCAPVLLLAALLLAPSGAEAGPVAALVIAATGATGFAATAISLAFSLVGSLVMGSISQAFQKKPKLPEFSVQARERTITARQPIAPWRVIYGRVRTGGVYTFIHTTGSSKDKLHLVITLAGHQVESIGNPYFDGVEVQLDGNGDATGAYAGLVHVEKNLGTPDQAAFAGLIAAAPDKWTVDHRQRGRAGVYVQLTFSSSKFPNGIPNITFDIVGKADIREPRDDPATTGFSSNWALCVANFVADPVIGLGDDFTTGIHADDLTEAANISDEFVETSPVGHGVAGVDAATNQLELGVAESGAAIRIATGDRVIVESTGALPAPLLADTEYYAIVDRAVGSSFTTSTEIPLVGLFGAFVIALNNPAIMGALKSTSTTDIKPAIRLASSYENALAGTAIDLTDTGSGNIGVLKTGEPRYLLNGTFETSEKPFDIIGRLMSAAGGRLIWAGGKWRIRAGAYRTPEVTLSESDIVGEVRVATLVSRRESFNGVKGVFVGPENNSQPDDFPAVQVAAYVTADGGEERWKDVDLPFTSSSSAAQRLARMELERGRRQITVNLTVKTRAWKLLSADTVRLSIARYGWSEKTFEVQSIGLTPGLRPQISLTLREIDANVFAWSVDDETVFEPAPRTALPSGANVAAPGQPAVTEELYVTRDGAGVKALARLAWTASDDVFVAQGGQYQVDYKLAAAADWTIAGRTAQPAFDIADIAPGVYDFRVKAINRIGVDSDYAEKLGQEITGLLAPPAAVTGLNISRLGGLAVIRHDRHADLDVRIGGALVWRHAPALSGATWSGSTSIGEATPGGDTVSVLPLKPGTYLVKARDSSGNLSTSAASVTTSGAQAIAFANVDQIDEHPDFLGTLTGVAASGGVLSLGGAALVDDFGSVDGIDNWDAEGGVELSGTYDFAAGIDLGAVGRVRLRSVVAATSVNTLDLIDDRTAAIDDWEDFDGTAAAATDCIVEVRETDDDPAGSPTWGPWNRLDAGEFEARAFDFRALLSTADPAYNINVTELTVIADEVA